MEEDIKILEAEDIFWNYPEKRVLQALENLLEAYKEDEAIIEEMAKYIKKKKTSNVIDYCNTESCTYEKTYCDTSCIIEYFRNKAKGKKE